MVFCLFFSAKSILFSVGKKKKAGGRLDKQEYSNNISPIRLSETKPETGNSVSKCCPITAD